MGVIFLLTTVLNMKFTITLLLVCALAFSGVSATNDTSSEAAELDVCTAEDNNVSYLLCPSVKYENAVKACDLLPDGKADCIKLAEDALELAGTAFDASTITDCKCPESSGTEVVVFFSFGLFD